MKVTTKASAILLAVEPRIAKVTIDINEAEKREAQLLAELGAKPDKASAKYQTLERITKALAMARHIQAGLAKIDRQLRALPDAEVELDSTEASLLGYVETA
jgi:hypothetical protein